MPYCELCDQKYFGPGVGVTGVCARCLDSEGDHRPGIDRDDTSERDVCPTCLRPLKAMTNAERQRRYRERKLNA